ncbi:MAG: YqeG family HAD IIIA-type phosphatase [Synechococcaceae cyanobacterium SM2_3_1]|nr:YqeG family HAD IIIA-type phosphatase [Synechococcaceae cyanobacterium SM2_3_1]
MGNKPFHKLLSPDLIVSGTVLEMPILALEQGGIRGIIFDVDDTLVPLRQPTISPEILVWVQDLQQHFQIWLVSNNISNQRIRTIAQIIGVPHINRAAKPSRRALRRALQAMELSAEQVAIVGDRLWTDVLAGNRLGLMTILVSPLPLNSPLSEVLKS